MTREEANSTLSIKTLKTLFNRPDQLQLRGHLPPLPPQSSRPQQQFAQLLNKLHDLWQHQLTAQQQLCNPRTTSTTTRSQLTVQLTNPEITLTIILFLLTALPTISSTMQKLQFEMVKNITIKIFDQTHLKIFFYFNR